MTMTITDRLSGKKIELKGPLYEPLPLIPIESLATETYDSESDTDDYHSSDDNYSSTETADDEDSESEPTTMIAHSCHLAIIDDSLNSPPSKVYDSKYAVADKYARQFPNSDPGPDTMSRTSFPDELIDGTESLSHTNAKSVTCAEQIGPLVRWPSCTTPLEQNLDNRPCVVKDRYDTFAMERKDAYDRKLRGSPKSFLVGDLVMIHDKN
jgi:hypothetical protein